MLPGIELSALQPQGLYSGTPRLPLPNFSISLVFRGFSDVVNVLKIKLSNRTRQMFALVTLEM